MVEIEILGCGSSLGVPVLGCKCSVCKSPLKYNKRSRSSILIRTKMAKILVDFGVDIRQQLLRSEVDFIDAALLTHNHADHVCGIDDLRVFGYLENRPLDLYMQEQVGNEIYRNYQYLFDINRLKINKVQDFDDIQIKDCRLQFFRQIHGEITSLGIRIGNFVYSSDVSEIADASKEYLQDLEVWVVDCVDMVSTKAHAGLERVLAWVEEYSNLVLE